MKPTFADTMIGAKNYQSLLDFYQKLGNFEITFESDLYTLLKDKKSEQILCICDGSPMQTTGPGWQTADFEASLKHLTDLGASVLHQGGSPDKSFQYAALNDPEGNPLLLWAGNH